MFSAILFLAVVGIPAVSTDGEPTQSATKAAEGKTILMVPAIHKSLARQMMFLSDELCQRGYNMVLLLNTLLTNVVPKRMCKNHVTVIEFDSFKDTLQALGQVYSNALESVFTIKNGQKDLSNVAYVMDLNEIISPRLSSDFMNNATLIKEIVRMNPDFAVVDGLVAGFLTLPYHLSIPFATISGIQQPYALGIPSLPSVVPGLMWTFSDDMNFLERLTNIWVEWQMNRGLTAPDEFLSTYAPGFSSYRDLFGQASLVIQVRDHHLDYQVPSMPYTLLLPGLTTTDVHPLPRNIQEFIGNSKFIVVSSGTLANQFPTNVIQTFVETFQQFHKFKFVWSLPDRDDIVMPPNVKTLAWIPQIDLLGHPNAVLFICHCGNSGQYEAAHQGVPMIGLPQFLPEQDHNCRRAEDKGISKTLHIQNVTVKELVETMRFVLNDVEMNRKAKKLSAILKSYKPPVVRAADAIEHVVKFGGEHLNGTARTMPAYKLYMLDIFAVIFFAMLLLFSLISFCSFTICKRLFCNNGHLKKD